MLVLLTVGVAAEQYGHGFLNFLGYVDVVMATILILLIVLRGAAAASDS